jgi:hypothetical protein
VDELPRYRKSDGCPKESWSTFRNIDFETSENCGGETVQWTESDFEITSMVASVQHDMNLRRGLVRLNSLLPS